MSDPRHRAICDELERAVNRSRARDDSAAEQRRVVRELVAHAASLGVPKAALMEITGRTRVTILRWIAEWV